MLQQSLALRACCVMFGLAALPSPRWSPGPPCSVGQPLTEHLGRSYLSPGTLAFAVGLVCGTALGRCHCIMHPICSQKVAGPEPDPAVPLGSEALAHLLCHCPQSSGETQRSSWCFCCPGGLAQVWDNLLHVSWTVVTAFLLAVSAKRNTKMQRAAERRSDLV